MQINNNSPEISTQNPQLSIVIPSHNEEGNVTELYAGLKKVLQSLDMTWEIIYSDDGSYDNAWKDVDEFLIQTGCMVHKKDLSAGYEKAI